MADRDHRRVGSEGDGTYILPSWLGGHQVSEGAYVVCERFMSGKSVRPAVVAKEHGLDEADVLRALAELQGIGVLVDA